jgi:protein gp37
MSTGTVAELIPPTNGNLDELLERESRIETATRRAFYDTGLELKAIREKDLYKIQREVPVAGRYSFQTFEEYCRERWEMNDSRARQLILAAEATLQLKTVTKVTVLPTHESHVRALLALDEDEERAEVWRRVSAKAGTVTAKVIEAEVKRYEAEKAQDWITLKEWGGMTDDEQVEAVSDRRASDSKFNSQDTDSIEWARWSWNPVTGCLHGCEYCYARDIANRFFPVNFNPAFYPGRLSAPFNTQPKKPDPDWQPVDVMGYRNVFVCSMADLFGKWVPDLWIENILDVCQDTPQWNYLFLTKFPHRMAEFDFPDNAWVGTSVDSQALVARAEKAFAKIDAKFKWLSCEPMLEELTFKNLDVFDWIVIGGASESQVSDGTKATAAYHPPFDQIVHLYQQARDAGVPVYMKTNLLGNRIREYPQ